MMNKKGMTLVELMVYMVLAALLLAPVVMLVQNSSVNMARDAVNVNLRMTGRELLNIIYDDLKNTGYKLKPNDFTVDTAVSYANPKFFLQVQSCDVNPNQSACPATLDSVRLFDVSSFMPANKVNGDYYDSITIRKARLKTDGAWADTIDSITYKVENRDLKRRLQNRRAAGGQTVTLARNVEALKFRYSKDLEDWYDNIGNDFELKAYTQYIKVIMVTKDPKKLSPTKTTSITLIEPGSGSGGGLTFTRDDQALYERHEIVVPIPNNGLFP
ncbi:MAG: prepilin-type N-terminal cleavage/methylation domain-containing protein [Chitinispirillales bacterium]|jgi:type II secretory pathway pseudopilin PulG|nr:prepilin-type N-terminal cleavage/methylation domain-containing protein [Chitinispirillales bacterium]